MRGRILATEVVIATEPARGGPAFGGVLEIAVLDALGLDNSLARSKVLIWAAGPAAKLLEAEREASFSGRKGRRRGI